MKSRKTESAPELADGGFEQIKPPSRPLPSAKSKAVAFLSRREHSRKELRDKLLRRGYSIEEVDDAIEWAAARQFQSDQRFGQSLIRRRASSLGNRAIEAELAQHGLSFQVTTCTAAENESQNTPGLDPEPLEAEDSRALEWLRKRYSADLLSVLSTPDSPELRENLMRLKAKALRGLGTRGFEFGNIHKAWKRLLSEIQADA
ncbi:recombination regulator RecX [Limnobacter humi]|uniref:Regulatory protein RecX n=1 Tax=Limnobacter humi TaxID=1778671 RepID=A0ABT1WBG2_9BURK|nr:regulatory protein RecX [Limnobacter humi]MCQ8894850.1 recombination regulator RecX [Limnobacter humi]